jgi:hypothetical protein
MKLCKLFRQKFLTTFWLSPNNINHCYLLSSIVTWAADTNSPKMTKLNILKLCVDGDYCQVMQWKACKALVDNPSRHHQIPSRRFVIRLNKITNLFSQVSTSTGVISHFVNLQVVVPEAFILGSGELHVDMGSAINLVCIIEKVSWVDISSYLITLILPIAVHIRCITCRPFVKEIFSKY